jgi:hypothetical protein
MSWLLKRAEGLLNDLDTAAASTIGKQGGDVRVASSFDDIDDDNVVVTQMLNDTTVANPSTPVNVAPNFSATRSRPVSSTTTANRNVAAAPNDDELFSFLNEPRVERRKSNNTNSNVVKSNLQSKSNNDKVRDIVLLY